MLRASPCLREVRACAGGGEGGLKVAPGAWVEQGEVRTVGSGRKSWGGLGEEELGLRCREQERSELEKAWGVLRLEEVSWNEDTRLDGKLVQTHGHRAATELEENQSRTGPQKPWGVVHATRHGRDLW